ncbi:MAG: hypothetical protein Q7R67_01860 [bacterium]|nr:hypothetical protein [bacterium]
MKSNRRAFLIWNGTKQEIKEIVTALRDKSWDVVYCVGEEDDGENDIPDVIFHRRADAVEIVPPKGIDHSQFPPVGEDIIGKLYEAESVLMTMMNRKVRAKTVDEKKHFYYEMLRYWHGIFNEYKPEVLILWAYPHNVSNFVVYSLAELFGIKIVFFFETWLSDRILVYHDYRQPSLALKQILQSNKEGNFTIDDLSRDIKEYYEPHRNRTQALIPPYVTKQQQLFPFRKRMLIRLEMIAQSIKDFSIFFKLFQFVRKFFATNPRREYQRLVSQIDRTKKFVYVPLHRQPEGSTSPMGGIFTDQILMIEILSASLPPGWVVYVKENIFQWSKGWHESNFPEYNDARYKGYYQKIAKLKNVQLVPAYTDSNYLTDNSSAIGIVSGRAGLEAVLRGKPALVFGHAWYTDAPGAFKIDNVEMCSKILKDIDENKISVTEDDATRFLASFDQVSFHGHIQPMSARMSLLTKAESTENIISALIKELDII